LYGNVLPRAGRLHELQQHRLPGRIALHEVMAVSEEIERLAVSHASSAEISKIAIAEGC